MLKYAGDVAWQSELSGAEDMGVDDDGLTDEEKERLSHVKSNTTAPTPSPVHTFAVMRLPSGRTQARDMARIELQEILKSFPPHSDGSPKKIGEFPIYDSAFRDGYLAAVAKHLPKEVKKQ